jgi:aspartyl aminopeptidase
MEPSAACISVEDHTRRAAGSAAGELLTFIRKSPSMFHSVETIRGMLDAAGFTYLPESAHWEVKPGGDYYTIRNHSSILAFRVGEKLTDYHFQMCASHSDSPTYKIKSVPEIIGPGEYLRLDVEAYGGMIDNTWFDRPLSVAGRVLVREGAGVRAKLLDIDRDLLLIPNVAIHFNREVNTGYKYNRQIDLCPLFSAGELKKGAFDAVIAEELGVAAENILGRDLFLVNRQPGTIWGYAGEFISSPKLDDLQCAYVSLKAFLAARNDRTVSVYGCFDNEEVGSNTKQGAMSTFLQDVLHRINSGLGKGPEEYYQAVAGSFLVSCDNAHAVHPNHPEKTDMVNCAWMNKGIVVKESANQKYTTDAFSRAVFTDICREAGVPVQTFANRSDSAGGSTLGNLSNTQVSVHAVDIGLPQLAMHSCYETAGVRDIDYAIRALTKFYQTTIQIEGAERAIFI